VFSYEVDLPLGATEVRLPSNGRIRILAMTAVQGPRPVRPAGELYAVDLPEPGSSRPTRLGRSSPGSSSRGPPPAARWRRRHAGKISNTDFNRLVLIQAIVLTSETRASSGAAFSWI